MMIYLNLTAVTNFTRSFQSHYLVNWLCFWSSCKLKLLVKEYKEYKDYNEINYRRTLEII